MISVIIPTYNEEAHIKATIQKLWQYDEGNLIKEIIIADGGSTDNTVAIAKTEGVKIVISQKKGRAAQMNYGSSIATEKILYFLHADTIPPKKFTTDIVTAVKKGFDAGCFRLAFDYEHWFLKANCWFTRFDINAFHYGDQSLFITRNLFKTILGFNKSFIVFEDLDIIRRIRKHSRFKIMKNRIVTSARKYLVNGVYKMQMIFYMMYFLERCGVRQNFLVSMFRSMVKQDKI